MYTYGFGFHGGFLVIPDDRALRIRIQSERLTNTTGAACLANGKTNYTLVENVGNFSVKFVTLVIYGASKESKESQNRTYSSEIELDENAAGRNISVYSVASYNQAIVLGTKCSQIHTEIEGTLVEIELGGLNNDNNIAIYFYIGYFATGVGLFICCGILQAMYHFLCDLFCAKQTWSE